MKFKATLLDMNGMMDSCKNAISPECKVEIPERIFLYKNEEFRDPICSCKVSQVGTKLIVEANIPIARLKMTKEVVEFLYPNLCGQIKGKDKDGAIDDIVVRQVSFTIRPSDNTTTKWKRT